MAIYTKSIETHYNGYLFRSRLEARWAVFFDNIGWKYEYEPEGFKADDGTVYLPDFYLPQKGFYAEVKPIIPGWDVYTTFSKPLKYAHNLAILLLIGPPDFVAYGLTIPFGEEGYDIDSVAFLYSNSSFEDKLFYQVWAGPESHLLRNDIQEENIGIGLDKEFFSSLCRDAIYASRSERFGIHSS